MSKILKIGKKGVDDLVAAALKIGKKIDTRKIKVATDSGVDALKKVDISQIKKLIDEIPRLKKVFAKFDSADSLFKNLDELTVALKKGDKTALKSFDDIANLTDKATPAYKKVAKKFGTLAKKYPKTTAVFATAGLTAGGLGIYALITGKSYEEAWNDLADLGKEALDEVVKVVKDVAIEAGKAAGDVAGGLLEGLGIDPSMFWIILSVIFVSISSSIIIGIILYMKNMIPG